MNNNFSCVHFCSFYDKLDSLNLPVPPGFILSSKVCEDYFHDISEGTPLQRMQHKYVHITKCCMEGIEKIEVKTNKRFAADSDSSCLPLVLSVRPSPPILMSG
jgi:phosphoenolpyruvate synthase/pyruvate phosphate dikinase